MKEKIKRLWDDRVNQSEYMKWLIAYSKQYAGKISLILVFNIATILISLGMTLITKQIIDLATAGSRKSILGLLIPYIICVVASLGLNVIFTLFSTMLNEKFSFGIRKQIYEKIIRSHWMDVKKYHTGDLMTRLTSDAGNVADGVVGTIPSMIQLVAELVLVFFTLFYYSPLLAVFAIVVAPFASIVCLILGRKLKRLQVKVQESEASYRSFLQESLANLLIVKAFSNEDYSTEKLVELREKRFYWVYKRTKLGTASTAAMSTMFNLGYIVAFTYGAYEVANGNITYGTMTLFLSLVNRIQAPVYELAQQIPKIVSILASAGRIVELQDIPMEEKEEQNIEAERIGMKVDHLTFGYENDDTVLENVSFDIKPGEFVAIVGESGIGKTTLIRLVMSFMSTYAGKISFFNDKGDKEKANAGTREFLSYVPQGNTLFSGTIRENLLMGKHDASDEEIMEVLKLSSGYDFVMDLPNKLDTVIGERGHGLSEGQAQRIAIARSFLKKAPFLILDEATSALDEKTEMEVLKGLAKLEPKPTCLLITHRRSILQYCDRELIIENKAVKQNIL